MLKKRKKKIKKNWINSVIPSQRHINLRKGKWSLSDMLHIHTNTLLAALWHVSFSFYLAVALWIVLSSKQLSNSSSLKVLPLSLLLPSHSLPAPQAQTGLCQVPVVYASCVTAVSSRALCGPEHAAFTTENEGTLSLLFGMLLCSPSS